MDANVTGSNRHRESLMLMMPMASALRSSLVMISPAPMAVRAGSLPVPTLRMPAPIPIPATIIPAPAPAPSRVPPPPVPVRIISVPISVWLVIVISSLHRPEVGLYNGHDRVGVFGFLHRLAFQSGNSASHGDQLSAFVHFRIKKSLAAGDESPGSIGVRQRLAITTQRHFQDVKCAAVDVVDDFDDSAAPDDHGSLARVRVRHHLRQGQRSGLLLEIFGDGVSYATRYQHRD